MKDEVKAIFCQMLSVAEVPTEVEAMYDRVRLMLARVDMTRMSKGELAMVAVMAGHAPDMPVASAADADADVDVAVGVDDPLKPGIEVVGVMDGVPIRGIVEGPDDDPEMIRVRVMADTAAWRAIPREDVQVRPKTKG